MEYPKPNYDITITANVRYDTRLVMGAKMIYGEIYAIFRHEGVYGKTSFTFNNDYFADLYSVTKKTISRWMTSLEHYGYITRIITYDDYGNQIRYIDI